MNGRYIRIRRKFFLGTKEKKMKKRNGFTLVEILIVVVILGILAAIVIPQFSDASEDAKFSSLVSDLQTVRSQIQLYKLQHQGVFPPGAAGEPSFIEAMTKYTNADGTLATEQKPADNVYGPYIQKIPTNQFNDSDEVTSGVATVPADNSSGWYYNESTGAFNANDNEEHSKL
jgi:general secretion pathway protein G